jgi:fatty acid desaturase
MLPRSRLSIAFGNSRLHNWRVFELLQSRGIIIADQLGTSVMVNHARNFIERSDYRAFLVLFRNWSAIFLITGFSIWANSLPIYIISIWIIGGFQYGLGEALVHEASHYNLFKKHSWNDHLEFLYALPFFTRVPKYRELHSHHHKYFGEPEDPKPHSYENLGFLNARNSLFFLWFVKPILGYAGFQFQFLTHNADYNRFFDRKILLFWIPVASLFYWTGLFHILLLYWFVPLICTFSSFLYWQSVDQHYGTESGTRTNVGFLMNYFGHNIGYHHVHHLCPTVPWYKLPEAHKVLCSEVTDISHSFFDTYRQLKAYRQLKTVC